MLSLFKPRFLQTKGIVRPTFKDLSYGVDPLQTIDIYKKPGSARQPAIFMVHGGAWVIGDKAAASVVDNKVKYWVPRGVAVISVNYPFEAPILEATNINLALTYIINNSVSLGIDGKRIIMMGHSAGAHLIAYLATKLTNRWLGEVVIDAAALDLPYMMSVDHAAFYDTIFGTDPAYWALNSPKDQYSAPVKQMYIIASTEHAWSAPQSEAFATQTGGIYVLTTKTHAQSNADIGVPGAYTTGIDDFMRNKGLY